MEGRTILEITGDVATVIENRLNSDDLKNRPKLKTLYQNDKFNEALASAVSNSTPAIGEDDEQTSKERIQEKLKEIEDATTKEALKRIDLFSNNASDFTDDYLEAIANEKPKARPTLKRSESRDQLLTVPESTPRTMITEEMIRKAINTIKEHEELKGLLNRYAKNIPATLQDEKSYQELLEKTTQLYDQYKLAEYLDKTLGITGVDEDTLKAIVEENIGLELDRMQNGNANVTAAIDAANAIADLETQSLVKALLAEAGDKAVAKFSALTDIAGGKTAAEQAVDLVKAVADSVGKASLAEPLKERTKKLNGAVVIESLKAIGLNPTLNNTRALAQLETNQEAFLEEVKKAKLKDFELPYTDSWIKSVFSDMTAANTYKQGLPLNAPERNMFLLPNDYNEHMANIPDQMKTVATLYNTTSTGVGTIHDPVELEKISYQILVMQSRLEVFRKNCELRKKYCAQGVYPSAEKKADNALTQIDSMMKTLENAQSNLSFARQLNQAGKSKVGYLGDKVQVFGGPNKENDAAAFIQTYLGEPANNGHASMRIGGERIKTKQKLNNDAELHVIATTLKTRIFGSPIATVAVQTKKGDAKTGHHYHQEIHVGQGLSGRRGFPFRRLPEDYVIEMAIVQVDNFLAALKDDEAAKSKPIILETGNLDKSCIEALQVVCNIRKVHYIIQGDDPFKNDKDRLAKMIERVREKDKSSQRYGGKLLSSDDHSAAVQSSIPRQGR